MLRHAGISVVTIIIAGTMFSVPLIMKYHVYRPQEMKVTTGDTAPASGRFSSVWCEERGFSHKERFDAFSYDSQPQVNLSAIDTSFTSRRIVLPNKAYEHWGFHLLRGSTVTVYGCARLPGASVTLVKGRHHLTGCITENRESFSPKDLSSEESSESESDDVTSSISSSQGVFSNESSESFVCNGALEYARFDVNISCMSTMESQRMEFLFAHEIAITDHYYVLFTGNPYLEIIPTDLMVHVVLQRTRYDTESAKEKCVNVTECVLPVAFASDPKMFVEVPNNNDTWWEESITTVCLPRKWLFFLFYLCAALAVFVCAFL